MRKSYLITALLAGGLALTATNLTAQNANPAPAAKSQPQMGQPSQSCKPGEHANTTFGASDLKASSIIGLDVRNDINERLGTVQDLIVHMKSHSVPFAIVAYGGALGIGETRVAVPLTDLKWSSQPRGLILNATKDQFESASATPTGGWAAVANENCLKGVDRYYGQPSMTSQSQYERQAANTMEEGGEAVGNPSQQKGATGLAGEEYRQQMTNAGWPGGRQVRQVLLPPSQGLQRE